MWPERQRAEQLEQSVCLPCGPGPLPEHSSRLHSHALHAKGQAWLTFIWPIPDGGFRQMSENDARHATPSISQVTERAGQPSSSHSQGPSSLHERRHRQICFERATLHCEPPWPLRWQLPVAPRPFAIANAPSHHAPWSSQ